MVQKLIKYQLDDLDKDGFSLYERSISAGTKFPLHWHEYIEFELILSGSGKHVYNNKEYIVEPGSAYMMCFYDFHELEALTDITLYSIHFTRHLLDPKIAEYLDYNQFHCRLTEDETQRISQRISELARETDAGLPFGDVLIRHIISELVILMIRKSIPHDRQAAPLPVQQVCSYMNEHFLNKLTLEDTAKALSFSPNYLGRLFKEQMNCTFNEYLHILRLKYACSLLQNSQLSVKEIAASSGYSSVEYFLYVFKQKFQMTPGEYRRQGKAASCGQTAHFPSFDTRDI